MRNPLLFVGNPDALLLSIAGVEQRIDKRQRKVRCLTIACRRAIASGMTSWQVLLAAGIIGFAAGLHADHSVQALVGNKDLRPAGRARRALQIALRTFTGLHIFPK